MLTTVELAVPSRDHEDHGKIPGTCIQRGSHDEAEHCGSERPDDVLRRVLEVICRAVVGHGDKQGYNVGGDGQEKRVHLAEAQRLDDAWKEARRCARNLDTDEEKREEIQTPVDECHLGAVGPAPSACTMRR